MSTFENFGLSEALNDSLVKMEYTSPTPIQEQAIPLAMEGHDILGSAQTGTGKTAAFSIPLIEGILRTEDTCAVVLTPTRELAKQVLEVVEQLLGDRLGVRKPDSRRGSERRRGRGRGKGKPQNNAPEAQQQPDPDKIYTAFIIGGDPYQKQMAQLKMKPRIIVGTPGRINDHLERGSIDLSDTGFLVLDETDRMLDMGFGVQLDRIIKHIPADRQTLMFSATLPKNIVSLSNKYLTKPQRVSVGATNVLAKNIEQEVIRINQQDKYQELLTQLHSRTGSVIIFVKTKHGADRMANNLRRDGFTSEALHGDLKQRQRDRVMRNFRELNFSILVATDIAARGLDVPHIEHVINYDLPQVAEDYIHRMGRTARGGSSGSALCFISPQDGRKWHAIEMLLDPEGTNKRSVEKRKKSGKKKKPARRDMHTDAEGMEKAPAKKKHRKGFNPNRKKERAAEENHDVDMAQDRPKAKGKPKSQPKSKPKKNSHPKQTKRSQDWKSEDQGAAKPKPKPKPKSKPKSSGKAYAKKSNAKGAKNSQKKNGGDAPMRRRVKR